MSNPPFELGNLGAQTGINDTVTSAHNLQAMVELEYLQVGNDVMNSALGALNQALTVTQGAIDQLSILQTLHNQIAIVGPSALPFNFTQSDQVVFATTSQSVAGIGQSFTAITRLTQTISFTADPGSPLVNTTASPTFTFTTDIAEATTATFTIQSDTQIFATATGAITGLKSFSISNANSYMSAYQAIASSYYGKNITPVFKVVMPASGNLPKISAVITSSTQPEFINYMDRLVASRNSISALIASLSAITKPGDQTTLLTQLRTVRADLANTSFSGIRNWVIDNYNASSGVSVTNRGHFEQDITNAMTAAQSTNTSQNEAVRRYMFVFEQYCQSAAAILTQLNTMFSTITKNIAG
jgi:hypothetical protein